MKKSNRPLSINTGTFTRGAKFTGSASGSDGCRLKPPRQIRPSENRGSSGKEHRRQLCAPAEADESDLVLRDIGARFEVVDRASHVLRPHDHVIAVGRASCSEWRS